MPKSDYIDILCTDCGNIVGFTRYFRKYYKQPVPEFCHEPMIDKSIQYENLVQSLQNIILGMQYSEARKEFHTITYWKDKIRSLVPSNDD